MTPVDVQFDLLGPLQVRVGDDVLDVGGDKQQRVLVALLMANGRVVSTDRLIEHVWEDRPPAKPHVTLRSYISHLRRVLEPDRGAGDRARLVVTRSPGYAVEVADEAVDLRRFESGVTIARAELDADPAAARQIAADSLALWRSSDLERGPLDAFPAVVASLTEQRTELEEIEMEAALALGDHRNAIPPLRRMVDEHPLRESSRRLLMLALYRSGRAADALAVMSEGRARLRDDLGLDPSPALTVLEHQILDNAPEIDWSALEPTRAGSGADLEPPPPDGVVGRQSELTTGRAIVEGGRGVVALIGEPGIGKSTVMNALTDHARSRQATVAWGRCHDGGQSTTLWPWITALRDLMEPLSDDTLDLVAGRQAAELAELLPEVGERLGIEPRPARDGLAVADAMSRVLRRLAERSAIVLAFEDLHWSDLASARLLTRIATRLADDEVVILSSWRDTELVSAELHTELVELGRFAGGGRFDLDGLDDDAIADLYRRFRADEPAQVDIDLLLERTAGNPLFLSEVLRPTVDDPLAMTTATIREAIESRLAKLSPTTVEHLEIAALARDSFTDVILSEVAQCPPDDVLTSLEQAMAAGLIEESPASIDEFQFSHDLLADQLGQRLNRRQRAERFAAIGRALERAGADIDTCAHYLLRGASAGTGVAGAEYGLQAARISSRRHDHEGADRLLSDSLAALDLDDDPSLRIDLLLDLAQEQKYQERVSESHEASQEAFRLAEAIGDLRRMAIALLVFSGQVRAEVTRYGNQWLGYWNPPGPSIDMAHRCLDKMDDDHSLRVVVELCLAAQLFGEHADPEQALSLAQHAIERSRADDDIELLAAALFIGHQAAQRILSLEDDHELLSECLRLADQYRLPDRELSARRGLIVLALSRGDSAEADLHLERSSAIAATADEPTLAVQAAGLSIARHLLTGRFAEAERGLNLAFERHATLGSAALDLLGIQYAALLREQGQHAIVADLLREKEASYPGPNYGMPLATMAVEQGDLDTARRIVDSYPRSLVLTGGEGVLQFSMLSFAAETVIAINDLDYLRRLSMAMANSQGRLVTIFDGITFYGAGDLYLARIATRLGDLDAARSHLDAAHTLHERLDAQPWMLRSHLAEAELAAVVGDPAAERRAMDDARPLAERLGMDWLIEHRRDLGLLTLD